MAKIEIELPAMGEGITEATITKFLKNEGDLVEEEEAIIEIATDKVDSEITVPAAGIIEKFLFKEGDEVPIGKIVAILKTDKESDEAKEPDDIISDSFAVERIKKDNSTEKKQETNQDEKSVLFVNKTPADFLLLSICIW